MRIIDISRDLLNSPIYPGDPAPKSAWVHQIAQGADCNLSTLFACVHTGTHFDAPLHFIEGGGGIETLDPQAFIGPCSVIELRPGEITGEDVNRLFPRGCERLLLKSAGQAFFMDSAAEEAAALGYRLIGTDALSIGSSGNQIKPHKAFLSADIAVLEGLELSEVQPGDYFLFAAPVKLGGLEGAPARAFLIADYIFWGGKNRAE